MTKKAIYILIALYGLIISACATTTAKKEQETQTLITAVTLQDVIIEDYAVNLKIDGVYTPSFTIQKPTDPFSSIVSLPGIDLGTGVMEKIASDKKGVNEIRITKMAEPQAGLSIEVLMDEPAHMEGSYANGVLALKIASPAVDTKEAADEAEKAMEEELEPAKNIISMGFGCSKGMLDLKIIGDGAFSPHVYSLEKRVVVDVPDVQMQAMLPDKFVSPVKAIRHGQQNGTQRFIIDLKRDEQFISSTVGKTIVITFPIQGDEACVTEKPAEKPEAMAVLEAKPEEKLATAAQPSEVQAPPATAEAPREDGYKGKLISLDFQDADIKPIIRLLAGDVGGYNVVLNPQVSGTINLRLKDVPWDKALEIILTQNNIEHKIDGNIMRVAPSTEFRKQEEEEAKRKEIYAKVADLKQANIQLAYIAADDMRARISDAKALSARGQITVDARTNTLIVNDTEESIKKILKNVIPYWDTPEHGTLQVLIEAKIVEVGTDYTKQFGIRWTGTADQEDFGFFPDQTSTSFSVNSPLKALSGAGGAINVGYADTFNVNLSLEALETIGHTKKLANPRILTIDKLAANITQGVQIPFTTTSAEGTKTEFKEASLSLDVTPEIQPNGIVKMLVKATNNTPVLGPTGETAISNQTVNTNALVKDGDTLVLGGIYSTTENESEARVPILGRIPILGWLFKTRSKSSAPKELLIFITPKIVK